MSDYEYDMMMRWLEDMEKKMKPKKKGLKGFLK